MSCFPGPSLPSFQVTAPHAEMRPLHTNCCHFPPLLLDKVKPSQGHPSRQGSGHGGSARQPSLKDRRNLFPHICSNTKLWPGSVQRQLSASTGTSSSLPATKQTYYKTRRLIFNPLPSSWRQLYALKKRLNGRKSVNHH